MFLTSGVGEGDLEHQAVLDGVGTVNDLAHQGVHVGALQLCQESDMSKVDPQHGDPAGKGPFGSTQDGAIAPEHDDDLDTALAWVHLAGIDRRQRHTGDLLLQGVALVG